MAKINIVNYYDSKVGITIPSLRFSKEWRNPNDKLPIEEEVLSEAIYDPGVDFMFRNGMLGFENPSDAERVGFALPGEYVIFSYQELEQLIDEGQRDPSTVKEALETMCPSQKEVLARLAIRKKVGNYDTVQLITEATGVNVQNAILINLQIEREDAAESSKS